MNEGDGMTLILFLVIGTLAMLILAFAIFFFFLVYQKRLMSKEIEMNLIKAKQQEDLLRTTIFAQEKERKRFAEDLHDEIGAMLSAIKMNLGRLEKKAPDENFKGVVSETRGNLDEVILNIRRITRALLPPSLERFGLGYSVEELLGWIAHNGHTQLVYRETGAVRRFDANVEMAVFRIIQELLNNALKYAGASEIKILLRYGQKYLAVLVTDNGKGYDVNEARGKGLGLQNLEGRTRSLGGVIRIKSKTGHGSSNILIIPI